jgi:hypothetical protein
MIRSTHMIARFKNAGCPGAFLAAFALSSFPSPADARGGYDAFRPLGMYDAQACVVDIKGAAINGCTTPQQLVFAIAASPAMATRTVHVTSAGTFTGAPFACFVRTLAPNGAPNSAVDTTYVSFPAGGLTRVLPGVVVTGGRSMRLICPGVPVGAGIATVD